MKYFVLIFICLGMLSCSNDSPENTVMVFHDAFKRMDIAKAKTVSAPETLNFLESIEEVMNQLLADKDSKAKFDESNAQKIKEYEAEGPFTCTCKNSESENIKICEVKNKDGKVSMDNIKVEKIDGKWLVKISLEK